MSTRCIIIAQNAINGVWGSEKVRLLLGGKEGHASDGRILQGGIVDL
jgi:hypothetical protein